MKTKFYRDFKEDYDKVLHNLRNKYYNLYRSNIKCKEGLTYREEEYVLKEFWAKGTVAAFNIKNNVGIGFAPWVRQSWDMYGLPETVNLINMYSSPVIPTATQVVDKTVVLGYLQSNHKPLKEIVEWYIERIAQVEMVIHTNLMLHKMPFVIPVEKDEKQKVTDIVDRILNDELVITVEGFDPVLFKSINTQTPYIIDKLKDYEKCLEYDLKTVMGVNNPGEAKAEQLQLAEVNAANAEINCYDMDFQNNLDIFSKQIKDVLGKTVIFEVMTERAEYDGEAHQEDGEQPGPTESEEE